MTEFSNMALKPELIESLKKVGFVTATDVQERSIPELLLGKNVTVRAKSGTGKTGAFMVPILQLLKPSHDVEAIVIAPTRELALQVADFASKVGNPLRMHIATIYGGASMGVQMQALRNGANIVVGTPGRIIDLYKRGALNLDHIKMLVLDEADVMLDMGFIRDVEYIISKTPRNRQMMLFSATMPKEIVRLAEGYSNGNNLKITVGEEEDITVSTIKHTYAIVPNRSRFIAVLAYIKEFAPLKTIIFARTKFDANDVYRLLTSQGHKVILLHGGLTQSMRERSLNRFRGDAQFLVATNVAARGIDVYNTNDVINIGAPDDPKIYVHRVGRSARMGRDGRAVTIIDHSEINQLGYIEEYANVLMHEVKLNLEPFNNVKMPARERGGFEGRGRFRGGAGGGFSRDNYKGSRDERDGRSRYRRDNRRRDGERDGRERSRGKSFRDLHLR